MDVLAIGDGQVAYTFWPACSSPAYGTEVTVANLGFHATGSTANFAMASARLGLKTALVTELGRDSHGRYALEEFRRNKVDTGYIALSSRIRTSLSSVLVHKDGRRSFATFLGTQGTFSLKNRPYRLWIQEVEPKVVYVGGYFLLPNFTCREVVELMKYSKSRGIITSFDLCWDPGGWTGRNKSEILRIIRYTDILFLNRDELTALTGTGALGKSAGSLQKNGRQTIAVKLGKDGCYVHSADGSFYSPSFRVKVRDTTGAGDAFNAGFLFGLLKGFPLRESAMLANAVAGLEVTVPGPDFHKLSIEKAKRILKRREHEKY